MPDTVASVAVGVAWLLVAGVPIERPVIVRDLPLAIGTSDYSHGAREAAGERRAVGLDEERRPCLGARIDAAAAVQSIVIERIEGHTPAISKDHTAIPSVKR